MTKKWDPIEERVKNSGKWEQYRSREEIAEDDAIHEFVEGEGIITAGVDKWACPHCAHSPIRVTDYVSDPEPNTGYVDFGCVFECDNCGRSGKWED